MLVAERLSELLKDGKPREALEFLTASIEVPTESTYEIVHVISEHFTESNMQSERELFEYCQTMLKLMAKRCSPMETVLELLEEVEPLENDVKFLTLLEPLSICIMRLEDKSKAIEWCVSTIKSYIEDVPVPDGEFDLTDNVRIAHLYYMILWFLKPFVEDAARINSKPNGEDFLYANYLLSLLISLCGKPFCFMTRNVEENTYRQLLENIVTLSFRLTEDALFLLDTVSARRRNVIHDGRWHPNSIDEHDFENFRPSVIFELSDNVSNLAYANFYFHVITNETLWRSVPQVYSSHYILETCVYLFEVLLCEEREISISNGLTFMESVVRRISPRSVDSRVLSLKVYSSLFESTMRVMVYRESSSLRKRAVHIFQDLIKIFNMEARYSIITHLYEVGKHSSLLGFLIDIFKSCVVECLDSAPRDPHFLGRNMESMLRRVCRLPRGGTTDLAEISDEVIATLNLLRFLFIRDKCNETGIWNITDTIERDYLKPLGAAIRFSAADWKTLLGEAMLEEWKQQRKCAKTYNYEQNKEAAKFTVTIGGERLPDMPLAERIALSHQAINGIDVMKSILARVNECINAGKITI